jgi:thiol:disulfide interchange protein DsbD
MRRYKFSIIAMIAVVAVTNVAWAQLSGLGPASKTVTAKAFLSVDKLRPGDKFQLAVRAKVATGSHVGAHDKDALYPAKLTVTAPKAVIFKEPTYPKAVRKSFPIAPKEKLPIYEGEFTISVEGRVAPTAKPGPLTITAKLDTQACKGDQCFPPELNQLTLKTQIAPAGTPVRKINCSYFAGSTAPVSDLETRLAQTPLVLRLLMLYGLGLLLAFTPCVYPMVPVTVGYFSTQSDSRTHRVLLLAAMYVLGLALTYSTLGAVAASAGGVFGAAMQSPAVIVGLAAVLVALALSMFGLYELKAPRFIQNEASGRSGVLGALFMGLVFGIVCAPCVGPVVLGLMTYVAHLGSPVMGFVMFFTLSLGLGTPLFALAAFSAKLPVPGMWMIAVRKAAGFLLLGAAAYFLMPILPDSVSRYLLPTVVVTGGIYLGFFEKSIRASRVGAGLGKATGMAAMVVAVALAVPKPGAHSLKWQPYEPTGVAAATKAHEPAMIDFTAKWCVACKELEHGPFSDPKVIRAAARFQHLRVDGTNTGDARVQAAVKRFSVQGFPTVIFIDASGQEVACARIIGFVNSQEMLKRMDLVK